MTVNDDDIALLIDLLELDDEMADRVRAGLAFTAEAQSIATHRETAFAAGRLAGLEEAAGIVVGYVHPDPNSLPGELFASAQIAAVRAALMEARDGE